MTVREKLIAFETILIKEFLRFIRIWVQTVIPPMVTMSLYFIIFGNVIGENIGDIDGFNYTKYIAPGLIMMSIITHAYSNVVSSFYSAKFHRHIDEMLISPMPNFIIVLGFIAGGVARGAMVGLAVTLVSFVFTDLMVHNLVVTISVALLTAILFSLGGLINGIFATSFDDISVIPTFVLTPLTYLGGIFYSIQMLPEFWQRVSLLNPILYMVNTFRYGILGVSDIGLPLSFGIILGFIATMYAISLLLLNRGVGIKT